MGAHAQDIPRLTAVPRPSGCIPVPVGPLALARSIRDGTLCVTQASRPEGSTPLTVARHDALDAGKARPRTAPIIRRFKASEESAPCHSPPASTAAGPCLAHASRSTELAIMASVPWRSLENSSVNAPQLLHYGCARYPADPSSPLRVSGSSPA